MPKIEKHEISFQMLLVNTQPKQLCLRDPLASLLLRFSPQSIWRTIAIVFATYTVGIVGGGFVVSTIYSQLGTRFLHIFDKRETPIVFFVFFVFVPLVWLFYVWQPRGFSKVLSELDRSGVIGKPNNAFPLQEIFKPSMSFNKAYYLLISIAAVIMGLLIWLSNISSPKDPFYFGEPDIWYKVNSLYFWIFFVPLGSVNVYIVSWIVCRQIAATTTYTRIFQAFEIKPKLFHPDMCNGLASLGDYAIYSALLAVLAGFWLFFFTSYPLLLGQPMNLQTDTILVFIIYVIAVPSLLLPPVWGAHVAMV
ncbi:MAG: hypothetical protein M1282_18425, partial [Chloroflexi bacterium]|nr:hypothetical protein [Chloroflexota bacterium]